MAEKSAIYVFTRDDQSAYGFMSQNTPATDAAGVVLNWALGDGRSYQTLHDQGDVYIARLTYDDASEQEAADDLNTRCRNKGLKRDGITELQVDKLRGE